MEVVTLACLACPPKHHIQVYSNQTCDTKHVQLGKHGYITYNLNTQIQDWETSKQLILIPLHKTIVYKEHIQ